MTRQLWSRFFSAKSALNKRGGRAGTVPLDRPISGEERAIAEWLLLHSKPSGVEFLPQLEGVRGTGRCSCGCPTVDLQVAEGIPPGKHKGNPIGDALGEVHGSTVGVMLLQSGGYLACLEVYALSDIPHLYGLPGLKSLRPFEAS